MLKYKISFLEVIGSNKHFKVVEIKNKSGKQVGLMISKFRWHWVRKEQFGIWKLKNANNP